MKYNNYQEFLNCQTAEFVSEVHGTNKKENFKQRIIKSCSLSELAQLDEIFNNEVRDLKTRGA